MKSKEYTNEEDVVPVLEQSLVYRKGQTHSQQPAPLRRQGPGSWGSVRALNPRLRRQKASSYEKLPPRPQEGMRASQGQSHLRHLCSDSARMRDQQIRVELNPNPWILGVPRPGTSAASRVCRHPVGELPFHLGSRWSHGSPTAGLPQGCVTSTDERGHNHLVADGPAWMSFAVTCAASCCPADGGRERIAVLLAASPCHPAATAGHSACDFLAG